MRDTRDMLLVLLSSLLMLTGCSRRDILDDYPVSGVDIDLDWSGVTNKLPEGVRVIFYPKNAEGRKIDTYLSVKGGKVKVPPGRYSVVVYNYDTETVQIRGEEAYETIEAFTGHCNGLGIAGTEQLVWGPGPLYVVRIDDLKIENSEEELQLNWKPKLVVKTYSFKLKVQGLEYVSSIVGSIEGMSSCYCLGLGCGKVGDSPIYFAARGSAGEVTGSFTVFGTSEGAISRAGNTIKLTLAFVKVDKSVQTVDIDVTDVVANSENGGGEGGDKDEPPMEIELPLEDEVNVEEPDSSTDINGGVDEWENENGGEYPID